MRQLIIIPDQGSPIGVTLHEGILPASEIDRLRAAGGVRSIVEARAIAIDLEAALVELVHRPAKLSAQLDRRLRETTYCRVIRVAPCETEPKGNDGTDRT